MLWYGGEGEGDRVLPRPTIPDPTSLGEREANGKEPSVGEELADDVFLGIVVPRQDAHQVVQKHRSLSSTVKTPAQ